MINVFCESCRKEIEKIDHPRGELPESLVGKSFQEVMCTIAHMFGDIQIADGIVTVTMEGEVWDFTMPKRIK
jgi:hypothetical protein